MLKLSVISVAATGNFDAKTMPLLLLRADTNFENISTDLVPRKELRFKKRRHDPKSSVAPPTLLLSSHQPPTSIRKSHTNKSSSTTTACRKWESFYTAFEKIVAYFELALVSPSTRANIDTRMYRSLPLLEGQQTLYLQETAGRRIILCTDNELVGEAMAPSWRTRNGRGKQANRPATP